MLNADWVNLNCDFDAVVGKFYMKSDFDGFVVEIMFETSETQGPFDKGTNGHIANPGGNRRLQGYSKRGKNMPTP